MGTGQHAFRAARVERGLTAVMPVTMSSNTVMIAEKMVVKMPTIEDKTTP